MRTRLEALRRGSLEVRDPLGRWQIGDGQGPVVDLHVHDLAFYRDVALGGSIGAADAYIEGRWDTSDLTALIALFARNADLTDAMEGGLASLAGWLARWRHRRRANTRAGSRRNIHEHYDLGNDLFELFLDPTMTYSCGIFERPDATLAQASVAKLDRVCRKLALRPGDRVVEIGTGWGSFAIHAASRYGCHVTTITLSDEQHALASRRVREAGLSDRIELLVRDYRDLEGRFDRLVSIEMIEAVGHENLGTYFEQCARLLHDDGAMLIQAITMPDQRYRQYLRSSDFIRSHVFPGSSVPSLSAMVDAVRTRTDARIVQVEEIGHHYARTLAAWRTQFDQHLDEVRALGYPERFVRLWRYYLCYCEAGFEERYTGTVQMLLHRPRCRLDPTLGTPVSATR